MADSKKTIADYVGDMVALQDHIEEALDRQLTLTGSNETAHAAVVKFHKMVNEQRDALKALQDDTGQTVGNPIKAAGATVLGAAAGVIDKVRTEAISKALRDDYTAFNHAAISYTMLHATAVALGDAKTAEVAQQGLEAYAGAVQEINHLIGQLVVDELKNDDHEIVENNASEHNRKMVDRAWQENKAA